jgi:hypothetical protein
VTSDDDNLEPLFREEALDFVARQRGPGELVRMSAAWTDRAYWALLGLVVVGVLATLFVRVGDDALLYVLVPALKTLIERLHA